ncbi:MAG TPA: MFS transporter [Trebonia sp.]|nr:MFS transporter [Trebonia sp.]
MCAACGVPTHVPLEDVGQPAKFAALRNPTCRVYLVGGALSMMADNVEHVITYWVIWQKFHSPALTGFEVISHWLPFLLLSPYFGALADRHDCRRLIQGAQLLFMSVSACWGILFFTGTLQVWNACVLLILHGMAGSIWMPAEQLMLEDFVGPADLPSAIRLNSTGRSLGILLGPVVGSALLLGLGPVRGIFCNIAIYLPLTVLMARTKYTGHTRSGVVERPRVSAIGALSVFREVRKDRVIVSMIVLAGLGSFFVGSAIQTTMPSIATTMSGVSGGTAYGVLLFANGLGGVVGGLLLEGTGWLRLSVRAALWSTLVYGASSMLFAFSHQFVVAALLLVVGGAANLATMSITQTVVQMLAPREKRGQVVGLYGVGANGMRLGSGFTVGLFGAVVGLRVSLGLSASAMCVGTAIVAVYLLLGDRRAAAARLAAVPAAEASEAAGAAEAAGLADMAELPELP